MKKMIALLLVLCMVLGLCACGGTAEEPAPETEQTETEQPETEEPEVETPINTQPDYVKELMEKGVTVLQGRSRGELDEMLAAIPSDIPYYAGPVGYYVDKGLYRIQVNRKED